MSQLGPVADLFQNYRIETVDLERDAGMVVRTVLTDGSWEQIEWLFSHYGWTGVEAVVREEPGAFRSLPESVRVFWANAFGMDSESSPATQSVNRWRQTRQVPDLWGTPDNGGQ